MDPMRASTGTVQLSSSYDPSSAARYSGYPSSMPYMSAYDPRSMRDPKLEAQRISSHAYKDHGHHKLKTEYAIRPRTRSNTMSIVTDNHLAPGPYNGSGARGSPVITSDPRRSFSPLPGKDPYVVPAASPRIHRNPNLYYTDYASDTGRLDPRDRAPKTHLGYSVHRRHDSHSAPWRYPPADGLRKGEDLDQYNAYSYTNPREQFERESVARLQHERNQYPRERPLSLTGTDDSQLVYRKEPRSMGPPPSQRGFDKLDRDGRSRRSTQGSVDSDVDVASHRSHRRRTPVHLHQDPDEGYSSFREDLEERHRHRRHRRQKRLDDDLSSRHSYDDRASRPALPPREPMASGALIPTGHADDLDQDSRADHRRSRTSDTREQDYGERGGRPRRVSRRRADNDSDAYSSDEDLKNYRREPSARRKPNGSDASTTSSDRASPYLAIERPRRPRSHSRRRPRDSSPPRQDLVKRVDSSSPSDVAPKGILKTPKDKFPEEPNPIREGVAPLKDAHKKGIPPGARWTKIDRRLVNPAALEAGKERFEERSDYVIVLRVLSKEEIQAYALKTQEIRDTRYHEYVRERRRRRDDDRRHGRATDDFSSDDEDEVDSPLGSDKSAQPKFSSQNKQMAEVGKST